MPRAVLMAVVVCASCDRPSSTAAAPGAGGRVLARVDGEVITDGDLAAAAVDALGTEYVKALDAAGRRKLLDSLVLSRVIAAKAERALSPEERADLERRMRLHREHLLVEQFLRTEAHTEAISADEVNAYYHANPERFGGGRLRHYDLVVGTRQLGDSEQAKVLTALATAPRGDWRPWVDKLARGGMPLTYREVQGVPEGLSARLTAALARLEIGAASEVILVDGRPHLARLREERQVAPRPLAEVSNEIERELLARRRREQLAQLSAEVLPRARVEYTDAAGAHP